MECWYTFFVEKRVSPISLLCVLVGSLVAPSGAYLEYANSDFYRHMLRKEILPIVIINRQP